MENSSAYERFENLQKAAADQGYFVDPEDARMTAAMTVQAVISYKNIIARRAMRRSMSEGMYRDSLVSQLAKLDEISDACKVEHVFTGDVNSDPELEQFVKEFAEGYAAAMNG